MKSFLKYLEQLVRILNRFKENLEDINTSQDEPGIQTLFNKAKAISKGVVESSRKMIDSYDLQQPKISALLTCEKRNNNRERAVARELDIPLLPPDFLIRSFVLCFNRCSSDSAKVLFLMKMNNFQRQKFTNK